MNYSLYIGKIQINITVPFHIDWNSFDKNFFKKTKYIDSVYNVNGRFVDNLKVDKSKKIYENDKIVVQKKENHEIYLHKYFSDYKYYAKSSLSNNKLNIDYLKTYNIGHNSNFTIWNLIHLEQVLLDSNGIVLHSSYIKYRDEAIIFTGPSGIGKSTQSNLWKNTFEKVEIINGDKCLLQPFDNVWNACGFPLHGTSEFCSSDEVPIKSIVILRQGIKDEIIELTYSEKVKLLFSEITVNLWNPDAVIKTFNLIEDMVNNIPIIMFSCTKEKSSVKFLHDYLFGGK